VLQCIAVHCSALQCVAVCCSALQCIAVHRSALQCIAVHCSASQCIAVHCSALQCIANTLQDTEQLSQAYTRPCGRIITCCPSVFHTSSPRWRVHVMDRVAFSFIKRRRQRQGKRRMSTNCGKSRWICIYIHICVN